MSCSIPTVTRKPLFLYPIIIALIASSIMAQECRQIGLPGKEITAIVACKVVNDTFIIAGTASDGVWYRRNAAGSFRLLDNLGATTPSAMLKGVRCLHVLEKTGKVFAGTDSGLASYLITSMIEPMWRLEKDITVPVTDFLACTDTLFCCTARDVYRSFSEGVAWAACSTKKALPPRSIASYTSLAAYNGICAGSKFGGPLDSWEGVLNSPDYGTKWADISSRPADSPGVGLVYDLAGFKWSYDEKPCLLAATGRGLQCLEGDLATSAWKLFAGFDRFPVRSMHISYRTRSLNAEVFVAGDSGVHVLWPVMSYWSRVYDLKANCITSFPAIDAQSWFFGTDDGIWQYSRTVTGSRSHLAKKQSPQPMVTSWYSLDGRRISGKRLNTAMGVVLVREKGQGMRFRKTVLHGD